MKEQLEQLKSAALAAVESAADRAALEEARVKFLGKKGGITAILKQMGGLSAEERPVVGQLANQVRADIESAIETRAAVIAEAELAERLVTEALDVTIPGKPVAVGRRHPMTIVLEEAEDIFIGMGFAVAEGPEWSCPSTISTGSISPSATPCASGTTRFISPRTRRSICAARPRPCRCA